MMASGSEENVAGGGSFPLRTQKNNQAVGQGEEEEGAVGGSLIVGALAIVRNALGWENHCLCIPSQF